MAACVVCGAPLPAEARFCPGCGAPLETPPATEERKLATVLFADLVGSTELGAQDPERTRALLDRFYDAMATEVAAAGGTVEKFAGDAVMAAFGAPEALEDHAERALHSALAMLRRLEELFGDRLALRIGVNTGDIVVGRPREGSSFVTGDAVNVAARLEQAAEPGQILVGERTVAAAQGAFEFEEPTTVKAKGKPGGVPGRRLVRGLSLMRPRGVSGLRRAFVGREAELDALKRSFGAAVQGRQAQLVTVLGDAGVGKTRLARELWEWLGGQSPEPLRRTGRCLSYGQGITYWPLAEVLREHLGLLDSDSAETVLRRLEGREILGLVLGLDVAADLHPLVARDRLQDAWIDFFTELAAARPAVLLVEDLHWAEDPLLDLLERLVAEVREPFLVLTTARPELLHRRPGWGIRLTNATLLELEPLSASDTGRLLSALVAADLPTAVQDLLVERAEGNPFFVEELVGTLIDHGLLVRTNGGWSARELPIGFEVPDSVQAVLAARIDLLDPPEKAALQAASVIGRIFWAGPVYELVGGVAPSLRVLEERDFIRRRSGSSVLGEHEFAIKHALTREVAYGSLPKAKRARMHAAFAGWLERSGAGRDEHASLLAHHYSAAVDPADADLAWADDEAEVERLRARAITWLARAAGLAAGRFEIDEALAMLARALELETDDEATIDLLRQRARVHLDNYDVDRFREVAEQALAQGPAQAVTAEIYADLALHGYGRPYMWTNPPSPQTGKRWLARALRLAEPGTEARGFALLARALAEPQDEGSAEAASEALEIGKALASADLMVQSCEAHALIASVQDRFQDACSWVERALAAFPHAADPSLRMHQHWLGGFVFLRGGRLDRVANLAHECGCIAAGLTPHDRVHAIALQALLLSVEGHWAELTGLAERVEATVAASDETPCQFNWRTLLVCALGFAHLGAQNESRRLEGRGCAEAVVAGPPEREPALLRLRLIRGELEEARRILDHLPARGDAWGLDAAAARLDALVALRERDRVEHEAAAFLDEPSYTRPFALRALGRVRGDDALVRAAIAEFDAIGLGWRAAETQALVTAS